MITPLKFVDRNIFRQEPDCYDGKTCDRHRPRWMTSYPKEGDEEVGETLEVKLDACMMPPGSRVTIEVPVCPECGYPADMREPRGKRRKWPNCQCGFSWSKWAEANYG